MTHTFEIVEAKAYHLGRIVRRLRTGHARALGIAGIDARRAHRELLAVFDESAFRRSWLIDGKLAAIGGVTGTLIDPHGFVWLAFTDEAGRFPGAIIKETRRQLAAIMQTKTELATTLIGADDTALRFASFLGFHFRHDRCHMTRREQVEIIKNDPALRIPTGDTFAVVMGYH